MDAWLAVAVLLGILGVLLAPVVGIMLHFRMSLMDQMLHEELKQEVESLRSRLDDLGQGLEAEASERRGRFQVVEGDVRDRAAVLGQETFEIRQSVEHLRHVLIDTSSLAKSGAGTLQALMRKAIELLQVRARHAEALRLLQNEVGKLQTASGTGKHKAAGWLAELLAGEDQEDSQTQFAFSRSAISRCLYVGFVGNGLHASSGNLDSLSKCLPQDTTVRPWRVDHAEKQDHLVQTVGSIPKIIWQASPEPLSRAESLFCESWVALNPSWEYRFLDADAAKSFMAHHFDAHVNEVFEGLALAQQFQMLRYALLVKYGGLYVNTDTLAFSSIESWLEPILEFGAETVPLILDTNTSLADWGLLAPPGHPFFDGAMSRLLTQATAEATMEPVKEPDPSVWTSAVAGVVLSRHGTAAELADACGVPSQGCSHGFVYTAAELEEVDPLAPGSPDRWAFGIGSFVKTQLAHWTLHHDPPM